MGHYAQETPKAKRIIPFFRPLGTSLGATTAGVIALIAVGLRYQHGRYHADDIEILGLYWHFVDMVWTFVVPLVLLAMQYG